MYNKSMKKNIFKIALVFAGFLIFTACNEVFSEGQEDTAKREDTTSQKSEAKITEISENEELLKKELEKNGIKAAITKLVSESDGGSAFDCHQPAHHIGRVGYKLFGREAFRACDASCHSGCYHGAMEVFLNEKGTTDLAKNIDDICSIYDTSFGKFECLHGVGHGVLAYLDYDMPGTIEECKKLDSQFKKSSCYGGMFMENVLTGQGFGASTKQDHTTPWVNKTDPQFPCNAIDQDWNVQYECYQMQTSWMLTMFNYDFEKTKEECLKAPEQFRAVCFKSFGRDAGGNTLRNPPEIVKLCNKVPKEENYYEECITGATNVIVDFWGPALKGQASELCALLDERGKKTCYTVLAGRLSDLFSSETDKKAVCETFETSYQNLCGFSQETVQTSGSMIKMKDDTFESATITIKKGEKVTLVNKGKNLHWPASNIHPTHGIYPEFDSKVGVEPGASWSFTFDKVGVWRFHDHLYPELKGVITVEE